MPRWLRLVRRAASSRAIRAASSPSRFFACAHTAHTVRVRSVRSPSGFSHVQAHGPMCKGRPHPTWVVVAVCAQHPETSACCSASAAVSAAPSPELQRDDLWHHLWDPLRPPRRSSSTCFITCLKPSPRPRPRPMLPRPPRSLPPWTGVGVATESPPCLLYTSPSPRDRQKSRMPSSA